ncbi:MAG: alkaline phosphatase family protein, partial [Gemmatimonadota bacterium]
MRRAPAGLVALGLDALDPLLVEAWARDGTLSNLAALMGRGTSGRIRGVEGFYVGSTWPSTCTGCDPAGHGMHYELQLEPGTYELKRVQEGEPGTFVRSETIWGALGRRGRRVAALDVPLAEP